MKFSHLNQTQFPHVGNVDVERYANQADYSEYDRSNMTLALLNVPWDVGLVHVGNAQIPGLGNVVDFKTVEERDNWFGKQPCIKEQTVYKALHTEGHIAFPLPFEKAVEYNYAIVDYPQAVNGVTRWCYFIRSVERLSESASKLNVMLDTWQTFIYKFEIPYMILERGHAPVAATSAAKYLENPIANCEYLLEPDTNVSEPTQVKSSAERIFNSGDMYACIATSADPRKIWGSKANNDWKTPGFKHNDEQGNPAAFVFAMKSEDLNTFLDSVHDSMPQFAQTIQALFFVDMQLLEFNDSFWAFEDIACFQVGSLNQRETLVKLDQSMFGYDERFKHLAKLYTSPYAHIELSDGTNTTVIAIEDTTGTIQLESCINLVAPFIRIDANILGVGGSSSRIVKFGQATKRNFRIGGKWYEYCMSWDVPTFSVYQDGATYNDYATHYDRQQSVVDYTTAYSNTVADADNLAANTVISVNTTIANNDKAQETADRCKGLNNDLLYANTQGDITYSNSANDLTNEYLASSATANQVANVATGAAGAIASLATGNVAGAITGVIGTAASAAVAGYSTQLTVSNNNALTDLNNSLNSFKYGGSRDLNNGIREAQKGYENTAVSNSTAAMTAQTANSVNTMKANAGRTQSAAASAVENQKKQAAIGQPQQFGNTANAEHAATRPMGVFANVVTQSKAAIARAGSDFLRYGYTLNQPWEFNGWSVMPKFTYWKCSDIWVSGLSVPDEISDGIRFLLLGGVTVWKSPEYIGKVSVFENK